MQSMNDPGLGQALHGGHHYENFPVASWLLPARMRPPTLALYAFARTGDDLADEGDAPPAQRLRDLDELRQGLALHEAAPHSVLREIGARLARSCAQLGVSTEPAARLIEAFEYDAAFQPFPDWASLEAYCDRSANPVGRLVLAFAGLAREAPQARAEIERLSDAVCSGLQLVNFAQDFGQDRGRHRPTLPQAEWPGAWRWDTQAARLSQSSELSAVEQSRMTSLLAQRGLSRLSSARGLPRLLRSSSLDGRQRLALEIALTIVGGISVAERVLADPIGPWLRSPKLSRGEMLLLIPRALVLWLRGSSRSLA